VPILWHPYHATVPPSLYRCCRYVLSGDSEGRCFFWEWSHAQKVVRTIKVGMAWAGL
jgi:hypothetical protein